MAAPAARLGEQGGVAPENRQLGDGERTDQVDDHRDGREPGGQADQQEGAADDLEHAVEADDETGAGMPTVSKRSFAFGGGSGVEVCPVAAAGVEQDE